ncbi:MAG: hypothetical protein GY827_12520 [Cytophagales bacterium]|nr:hypothetical protein [Cytophagales bacterium]
MYIRIILSLSILLSSLTLKAQENNIFDRLSVLDNNFKMWYNIDGYSVTSETLYFPFDKEGLDFAYYKFSLEDDSLTVNKNIKFKNLFISKKQHLVEMSYQTNTYYLVENLDKTITVIWFIKVGISDRNTEEKLVNAIISNSIPEKCIVSQNTDSIMFAERKVSLDNTCYWTFLNTIQCPYLGEMNWSLHRTLESAEQSVNTQYFLTKQKEGKIVIEESIDIIFEGVPTKAKRVIFEFTGATKDLASMSGGTSLIIYYIVATVRNRHISCVFSHWNNDQINPATQLPPLLEKFIKLKE